LKEEEVLTTKTHADVSSRERIGTHLLGGAPFSVPLAGICVVERGARLAVGACGSLLRDLGAQVHCSGDYGSSSAPREYDGYAYLRHGKTIVANAALGEAESAADVVLLSSDVADVQGATSRTTSFRILCDITAFGTEPVAGSPPLTDLQIQALSAIIDTTGLSNAPPTPIGFPVVEMTTGLYAAAAVLAALRVRRLHGRGQNIDMSLFDCAFVAMATFVPEPLVREDAVIARMGNTHPSAAPWNTYRAEDGSLVICAGNSVQWQRLCRLIGRPEMATSPDFATQPARVANRSKVDAAIEAWTQKHTVEECSRRLSDISIANGRVVRNDAYPRERNLIARKSILEVEDARSGQKAYISSSPIRVSADSAERVEGRRLDAARDRQPQRSGGPVPLPLHGIRIIEIGQYTTAPLVARYCANLGADVIKVEPPGGESTRTWPPLLDGKSIFCRFNNSGKRMISLDLKAPQDAEIFKALIRSADVIIENMKPGALAKLGFSFDDMRALNERLVYCSINGYGAASLYPVRPAYDTVIQAESGIMDAVNAAGEPVKTGISTSDLLGAQFGLLGVIAALEYVVLSGSGVNLDISMQDASAWVTQLAWDRRADRRIISTIACRDGYVVAAAAADKPLDALRVERCRHMTKADADTELRAQGIEAAPVLTVGEMIALPVVSRRKLVEYRDDGGVRWPILACPLRLSETPPLLMDPAAPVDFHRTEILSELHIENKDAAKCATS
jgi:crotonobetainyl-CoA:carnitine CoA-transferase CaiB-like acyl-CoA transferase